MRKSFALGITIAIVAAGVMTGRSASASDIDVIDCHNQAVLGTGPAVHNPFAPNGLQLPALGTVVGPEDPCADLNQTLVFMGTADLSNGLNFTGTSTGAAGGVFTFYGDCAMVNWSSPTGLSGLTHFLPVVNQVTSCTFVNGSPGDTGTYSSPGSGRNAIVGPLGDAVGVDPAGQASCLNSSGSGRSIFTPRGVDGSVGSYVANYSWSGSLDNLQGNITDPAGNDHVFDAKVEAHADPAAVEGGLYPRRPLAGSGYSASDSTDAGCLQKTADLDPGMHWPGTIGLNDILIVGTATWDSRVPKPVG
jgi:hypothetical protein